MPIRFSDEEKQAALADLSNGMTLDQVSKKHKCSVASLQQWKKSTKSPSKQMRLVQPRTENDDIRSMRKELEELRAWKKQYLDQQEEREWDSFDADAIQPDKALQMLKAIKDTAKQLKHDEHLYAELKTIFFPASKKQSNSQQLDLSSEYSQEVSANGHDETVVEDEEGPQVGNEAESSMPAIHTRRRRRLDASN